MAQDLTSVQWANPQNNLTDPQKEQARTNIGAGQTTVTTFHSSTHGQSYETPLEKITIYSDGIVMSNGGQVLAGAPVPQPEDEGKVLVAHVNDANQGIAEWKELESSQTKIKHEFFYPAGGSDRQTILEVFEVPQLDGKWPTKIVGTFNCSPKNGFTDISVLPLESYSRQLNASPYTIETPTIFPDTPSPNWYIYQYSSPGDSRIKNISSLTTGKNNTVNFALEQDNNKLLKYIAIKGFGTSDTTSPKDNYNISNLNFTYYYD